MKLSIKVLVLFFGLSLGSGVTFGRVDQGVVVEESSKRKPKPKPDYQYYEETKTLHFIDAIGTYRVNNMSWEVLKEGKITEKGQKLDLTEFGPGELIIEIEYQGYVFVEDIFL